MKYSITTSELNKYVWFQIPKSASCSIRTCLEKYTNVDENTQEEWSRIKYFPNKYKSYFKFTFVRNPYSRLVSCWKDKVVENRENYETDEIEYMRKKNFSFSQFVKKVANDFWELNPHWNLQCNLLIENFETELNFIGKVENFESDINFVMKNIGIVNYQSSYHSNTTNHKHYTEYYDDETREIVAEKYTKDIKYFGYEFEK